jgi:hypothetical protein
MTDQPQCPFCLRDFETVEHLTQHLIFDNCQVMETTPAKAEEEGSATPPVPDWVQE